MIIQGVKMNRIAPYELAVLSITTHKWLVNKFKARSGDGKFSHYMTAFLMQALENEKRIEQLDKENV